MNDKGRKSSNRARVAGGLAVAVALLGLAACYPGGPENSGDTGLVITSSVPDANYDGMRTYAMEDTVWALDLDNPNADQLDPRYNAAILEELRAGMSAAGFTDVTADTATVTPDVWLLAGSVEGEIWYYYSWGGYPGYPGGWYYPPYVGVGSFTKGSVLWTLVDYRGYDPGDPDGVLPTLWYGALDGALANSASTNESRIRTGIRQGFTQSPYIKAASGKAGNGGGQS